MSAFVLSVVLTQDTRTAGEGTRQRIVPGDRWAEFSVIQDMGTPEQRVETMRVKIDQSFPMEVEHRAVTGADLRVAAVQSIDLAAAVALVPDGGLEGP